MIYEPLTKLQCSPTSDGSGAAILASEDVRRPARPRRAGRRDRRPGDDHRLPSRRFETRSAQRRHRLRHERRTAARAVYEQAGLGPEDFQVIELHDCFSANELLTYEALGLCGEGEAPASSIDDGDTTYGGRWVVNPSGGLISKGHPLGATGLAQCAELTWQLRGTPTPARSTASTPASSTTSASAAPPS